MERKREWKVARKIFIYQIIVLPSLKVWFESLISSHLHSFCCINQKSVARVSKKTNPSGWMNCIYSSGNQGCSLQLRRNGKQTWSLNIHLPKEIYCKYSGALLEVDISSATSEIIIIATEAWSSFYLWGGALCSF